MRYKVAFDHADETSRVERWFTDRDEATDFAKRMREEMNAANIELWAVQMTYHNITERIYQ